MIFDYIISGVSVCTLARFTLSYSISMWSNNKVAIEGQCENKNETFFIIQTKLS